jgi:hypothetical protein
MPNRFSVIRADDLLVCELEFVGIAVTGTAPNRTLTTGGGADTIVVVHFPPQSVAEEAFHEQRAGLARIGRGVGYAQSRIAGPSQVAFRIDPSALPIPFRLADILTLLSSSALEVVPSAARGPAPGGCLNLVAILRSIFDPPALTRPNPNQTGLELPFRLIISPESEARFVHRPSPVRFGDRNELWHTELAPAADRSAASARAIWLRQGDGPPWNPSSPKWSGTDEGDAEPFPIVTMSQHDRSDIVHESGNRRYALETGSSFSAAPFAVNHLALSALGGWLDAQGDWDPPIAITNLLQWVHRATQGRDHYVRIVRAGFLYPFGHLAAKLDISERKWTNGPGNPPVIFKRTIVMVRRPVKTFAPGAAPAGQAHTMPLSEVQIRTLITPDLNDGGKCFLITPYGHAQPFLFKTRSTDVEGHTIDLLTPLVFVDSTLGWDATTILKAKGLYDAAAESELDARGAHLAIAPGPKGDTTYPVHAVRFTAPPRKNMPTSPPLSSPAQDQPGFWPELMHAVISSPALDIVAGQKGTAKVAYHDTYVAHGLGGGNVNEVIAAFAPGTSTPLDFSKIGDRSGGLMQPSMSIEGLSRQLGPVGGAANDLGQLAGGTFDPKAFFAGAAPKLFGVFTLDQVLAMITGTSPSDVPRLVTEGAADALVAKQVWKPTPQSFPATDPIFVVDTSTDIELSATIDARSPGTPKAAIDSFIRNFEVHLLGGTTFIQIAFKELRFSVDAGKKPDVNVDMGDIQFVGPLSFVETLKSIIPLNGFSDPPALDVTPAGITASFSLALPNLAVGVFALQNISLGAGFSLPFVDGALTVSFNFCTRAEPFCLTVSLFGGGGFFGISIDPNGVQMLEAALEFGASAAINLGVAQGGVHVMAGVYFKIESGKGCTLTGYLRLGGNMSVLGLISASIELNLSFTYKDKGKAYGKATISIEIDIFLFSFSVEVSCERQFAGSDSDPTFEELMAPYTDPAGQLTDPWTEYCAAYA